MTTRSGPWRRGRALPGFVVLSSLLPTFSNQPHSDLVISPLPEVTRKDPKSQRGGHFEGAAENVDGGATEVTLGGHQVPRAEVPILTRKQDSHPGLGICCLCVLCAADDKVGVCHRVSAR